MASALPAGILGIDELKPFQRINMDPNSDYQFTNPVTPCIIDRYTPPCPNGGSDITYILRYLVNKYMWLHFTHDMVIVKDGVLKVKFKMNKLIEADTFGPSCSDTRAFIEIKTSLNLNMDFSKGNVLIRKHLSYQ